MSRGIIVILIILLTTKNSFSLEFLSKDLSNALSQAYNYNYKIKIERKKLFEKDEMIPQAFSEFRPSIKGYYNKGKVDTAISGSNFIIDGVRTETNSGVKINQPIFNGGSTLSKIKSAENLILSQRFNLKNTEQMVFLETIKVYSEIASLFSQIDLNKKNVEFLKKQLDLTNDQFEIGDVTLTDLSIAKSRLLLGKSKLIKSESELIAITQKYESIIGVKPIKPELFFNFPKINLSLKKMLENSIKLNPNITSIKYKIKSIKNEVKTLQRKKLPTIELEAEARKNKGYFKTDSSREVMSAFTIIDIPIYQSGAASSKIREIRRKLESEKDFLNSSINDLKYQIVESWSAYNSSESKIDAYKEQIEANKKFLEGLKQELFLGERTTLDILDGEQELLESSVNLVKSYQEYFNSYFEILSYLGNLNPEYLNLDVEIFDDEKNFREVKYKWLDLVE